MEFTKNIYIYVPEDEPLTFSVLQEQTSSTTFIMLRSAHVSRIIIKKAVCHYLGWANSSGLNFLDLAPQLVRFLEKHNCQYVVVSMQ